MKGPARQTVAPLEPDTNSGVEVFCIQNETQDAGPGPRASRTLVNSVELFSNWPSCRLANGVKSFNPGVPIGPWLAATLTEKWDHHFKRWKLCRESFSEECVHELRVATRRLLAHLSMVEVLRPGKAVRKCGRALKVGLKSLGELRDVHVMRTELERLSPTQDGLFPWIAHLRKQERKLGKDAARKVCAWKQRRNQEIIKDLVRGLGEHSAESDHQAGLKRLASLAIAEAYQETLSRLDSVDADEPKTIHRVRVAFKRFRYMVEAVSPGVTGLRRTDLRRLATYQRRMGAIQDLEVLRKGLVTYLEVNPKAREALQPFCTYLERRSRGALRNFLKHGDELRRFWPVPGFGACP